jgi:AcrR family transcriptional regulator
MQEVAAEAGVSRGALYRHFAGREALVDAVIERMLADVIADAARSVDRQHTLAGQLSEAIRLLPATRTEPLATVLNAEPEARVGWLAERWQSFWRPRLLAAQERGEVRSDLEPDEAVDWITRVQLSFLMLAEPGYLERSSDPQGFDRYIDEYLLRGLGA